MKRKCERCRHLGFDFKSLDVAYKCKKEQYDLSKVEDMEGYEVECEAFKSKYIEYPISVTGIQMPQEKALQDSFMCPTGSLVKIRPCAKEYENKTFLGIYLGDIDIGLHVSHYESGELKIYRHHNPAIFVPALKKVIYGCESWWGKIQSEEELRSITNEDIDNVWYVQMLKAFEPKAE